MCECSEQNFFYFLENFFKNFHFERSGDYPPNLTLPSPLKPAMLKSFKKAQSLEVPQSPRQVWTMRGGACCITYYTWTCAPVRYFLRGSDANMYWLHIH